MNIGIIGNGFVGKATNLLKCKEVKTYIYDINPDLCDPTGIRLEEVVEKCSLIFISVPTPMDKDGSCCLRILETVVNNISKKVDLNTKNIVIRSTVPTGTSDKLNCYFMPEFLTEKNFKNDFVNNEKWIFGLKDSEQDIEFKKNIMTLINYSYNHKKIKNNSVVFLQNKEAEMVKLFRNTFLATKVSFCNEFYEYCNKKNVNYENIRKVACMDKRIGESHSRVPGHDGKRGFGGTCFPKDINNLYCEMKKNKIKSYLVGNVIKRNEEHDRPGKDWVRDKGRAVV